MLNISTIIILKDLQMNKPITKKVLRDRLKKFSIKNHDEKSKLICNHLGNILTKLEPSSFGAFIPTKNEPSIWPIITQHAKKTNIYLPKFNHNLNHYEWALFNSNLVPGKFNIQEPESSPSNPTLDLCLVPALGIDQKFNRLGWGFGFFDRLLSDQMTHRIGIIFEQQLISDQIHVDDWDISLTSVITETKTYGITI